MDTILNYLQHIEVITTLISGFFGLLSTLVAAICAAIIGKRFHNSALLKAQLEEARRDISFLLAVEEEYGIRHKEFRGTSGKITVRDFVRSRGLLWSGNHTPGRVK